MKRRRRGGLGSSAAEHKGLASRYGHMAIAAAGDSIREVENGACGRALTDLADGLRYNAREVGEMIGARVGGTASSFREVDRAYDHFQRNCLRR